MFIGSCAKSLGSGQTFLAASSADILNPEEIKAEVFHRPFENLWALLKTWMSSQRCLT
jgi:hypothetical protein